MEWKSVLIVLAALLEGGKTMKAHDAKTGTWSSSLTNIDEKKQSPQVYLPPSPVRYPDDYCQHFNESEVFDFVVIGAGPGGATVARRLAEDPEVRVLLIEAGGNPPPQSDIPSKFEQVEYEERWHFDNCVHTEEGGGKCNYRPGKFLGGSTVINTMNYVRGNRKDFDDWEKMGSKGWSYKDVLPYFIKSETYTQFPLLSAREIKKSKNPNVADKKYHGTKGPMYNSGFKEDPFSAVIRDAMIQAQVENGIRYNPDVNGADQMGVTNFGGIIDTIGYRNSAAKAYLLHIPDNLKVCKYSTALKIELSEKSATGVNFQYNGTGDIKDYLAKAKREYIVSAGPFNSAPLLERSGIGRRSVLERIGVEVKHELSGVGENFQNHASTRLLFRANLLDQTAANPLSTQLENFGSFINTSNPKSSVPDVEILGSVHTDAGFLDNYALGEGSIQQLKDILDGGQSIIDFGVLYLKHPNPGSIHITQTEDPTVSPRIITNELTTQLEKDIVTKAIHTVRKFMSSEVLKPFSVEPIIIEDCKEHEFNSEEEILCAMKILTLPFYHACGMTAMGAKEDPKSVVDPELRIIGLDNVRIVDSGIVPVVPSGHMTPPTVMIGEKAADMIKNFWRFGQRGENWDCSG